MNEHALPPLRDVIAEYGLRAKKSLGQNFLLDLNLTARIARAANISPDETIVEIGPGPGGLTRALLDSPAKEVISVERDERCIEALGMLREAYGERFKLIEGDALEIEITDIAKRPVKIVANLPYNIATPLLIKWLSDIDGLSGLTLMFQREVAERITARPGTKAYGRLSVISQWLCHTELAFNVDRRAFTPPPKVTSSIVTLSPRANRAQGFNLKTLERVTQAAFGQRRKMLRASLKSLGLGPDLEEQLNALRIDPKARAEDISVEAFCRLSQSLEKKHTF